MQFYKKTICCLALFILILPIRPASAESFLGIEALQKALEQIKAQIYSFQQSVAAYLLQSTYLELKPTANQTFLPATALDPTQSQDNPLAPYFCLEKFSCGKIYCSCKTSSFTTFIFTKNGTPSSPSSQEQAETPQAEFDYDCWGHISCGEIYCNCGSQSGKTKNIMYFPRELKKEMSGEDVARLQRYLALSSIIYPEAKITRYFGTLTEKALERFQVKYGLSQTGKINLETILKLNEITAEL